MARIEGRLVGLCWIVNDIMVTDPGSVCLRCQPLCRHKRAHSGEIPVEDDVVGAIFQFIFYVRGIAHVGCLPLALPKAYQQHAVLDGGFLVRIGWVHKVEGAVGTDLQDHPHAV